MATPAHARSVAVLSRIPELTTALAESLPGLNFLRIEPEDNKAITQLKDSDIIISDMKLLGPIMYELKNVKWVQSTWAGAEVLLKYVNDSRPPINYPIVRFTGLHFGRMMAEYVVTYIVSLERDLKRVAMNQKDKKWDVSGKISNYRVISDLTIGILGLGTIGSEIAKCINIFGAKVWGMVRTIPEDKLTYVDEYRTTSELPSLLGACDYVISVLPDTEETAGLLNLQVLSAVKSGGVAFINVGRGSVIKDEDLVSAIERGYISAAVLDVFNSEPLPADSRLWSMPQVTITPHSSAVSRAMDIAQVFTKNYATWEAGQQLPNVFQFNRGY